MTARKEDDAEVSDQISELVQCSVWERENTVVPKVRARAPTAFNDLFLCTYVRSVIFCREGAAPTLTFPGTYEETKRILSACRREDLSTSDNSNRLP